MCIALWLRCQLWNRTDCIQILPCHLLGVRTLVRCPTWECLVNHSANPFLFPPGDMTRLYFLAPFAIRSYHVNEFWPLESGRKFWPTKTLDSSIISITLAAGRLWISRANLEAMCWRQQDLHPWSRNFTPPSTGCCQWDFTWLRNKFQVIK